MTIGAHWTTAIGVLLNVRSNIRRVDARYVMIGPAE
jgi:hypothetical protein